LGNESWIFESARRLAVAKLNQIHPSGSLPEWVDRAVTIGGARSAGGEWRVDFIFFEKEPLEDGEQWSLINGSRVLLRLNAATGNEMVVLTRGSKTEPLVVFSVLVDPSTAEVSVLRDCEFAEMNADDYEVIV